MVHVATHDLQRPARGMAHILVSIFYVEFYAVGNRDLCVVFLHLHRVTKSRRRVLFVSNLVEYNTQSLWLPLFLITNARWSSLDAVPRFVEWDGA